MGEFDEKVVIVTGAARGLGRVFSLKFLEEGARVVAIDINREGLKSQGFSSSSHVF